MSQLGPNETCHCGSGKKYKKCCRDTDSANGIAPVKLTNGTAIIDLKQVKVSSAVVTVKASPIPDWLLRLAGEKSRLALLSGAAEQQCLEALLYTTMAGEAVLNRLLEPLCRNKWEGNKGVERWKAHEKWIRLYSELGVDKTLNRDKEPLKSFLTTLDVRHRLMHFKHGQNLERTEIPIDTSYDYKRRHVTFHMNRRGKPVVVAKSQLEEDLAPNKVREYFNSLVLLLRPVLKAYPEDEFGVVATLSAALDAAVLPEGEVPSHAPKAGLLAKIRSSFKK